MKTFILLTISIFFIAVPVLAETPTVSSVEKHLMCTCGCTMPLYTCECQKSEEMRTEIKQMIERGMTQQEILDSYVSRFGEKILSAPTKKGFNLVAWILPFLSVILVGGVLIKTVKRWSHPETKQESGPSEKLDPKYLEQLENELSHFEEKGE
ncbi:MAG: cytochrome c-type biogenesis protein CcmH [Calditrichaeota bacterium]|nr:MAG: cytochrome c-type biogenesis protein CcmH [Calditrichota bacterium]